MHKWGWLLMLTVSLAVCARTETTMIVAVLETRSQLLEGKLNSLESSREADELMKSVWEVAYLTPSMSGYSVIRTDLRVLTAQLADVRPYANGSRVTLR